MTRVALKSKVLEHNDRIAGRLRTHFHGNGTFCLNLIGSPGSGKTTLLEAMLPRLAERFRCGVVEGDVKTDNDLRRIVALGIPAVQIETGGVCHLTADMVENALGDLADSMDLLVIENVGNLICTVAYDLGEDHRLVVVSIAEGEDKPLKYPAAFVSAHAVVVTKIDLEPYVDARVEIMVRNALSCNPSLRIFPVSARTGEGVGALAGFIAGKIPGR
jgi:hydrogenase nickel incorporation protein HypB